MCKFSKLVIAILVVRLTKNYIFISIHFLVKKKTKSWIIVAPNFNGNPVQKLSGHVLCPTCIRVRIICSGYVIVVLTRVDITPKEPWISGSKLHLGDAAEARVLESTTGTRKHTPLTTTTKYSKQNCLMDGLQTKAKFIYTPLQSDLTEDGYLLSVWTWIITTQRGFVTMTVIQPANADAPSPLIAVTRALFWVDWHRKPG